MKRRLFELVLVTLLCLIGVGFARGWFAVSKPQEINHKVNLELSVSPEKMKDDAKQVGEKVKEVSREVIQDVQKKNDHPTDGHSTKPAETTPE